MIYFYLILTLCRPGANLPNEGLAASNNGCVELPATCREEVEVMKDEGRAWDLFEKIDRGYLYRVQCVGMSGPCRKIVIGEHR